MLWRGKLVALLQDFKFLPDVKLLISKPPTAGAVRRTAFAGSSMPISLQ
jgi:hypothetical protein